MSEIYKICLLEEREFLQSDGERNVLGETDFFPEIGSPIEINGALYTVVSSYKRLLMIGVRAFEFNEDIEEDLYEDGLTCPFCSYVYEDAIELSDEGVHKCVECGSHMEYERVVEVKYSITPKKKSVPIPIVLT